MDFSLSAGQQELKAAAADFARRELNKDLAEREEAGTFSRQAWRACATFGIQALPVPAELGGGGADILTTVLVMEALGYGCHDNGLLFSLNAQLWSLEMPLVKFGTPAQQQAYLPGLMAGDLIGVHAMTEPDSGSDAFSLRTRAERDGDSYVLSGTKLYITNAPVADVLLVFAAHPGRPKLAAVSAFLVEKGTPGCTVTRGLDKMGLRTSPMGEVVLDGCRVPAGNRLGPEGAGMAVFNSSMTWERSCILASALGTMQRQLEACVAYARTREQFGQPIGKFQAVAGKVADMYLRLEAARLLVYQAAWLGQQGQPALAEAAAAKLFTSEAWVAASMDAIAIHGAYGYMKESGIERDLRDAIASTIYSGTSEIQRVILARMLGLLPPGREGGEMAYLLQHLLADSAARGPRRPAVTAGERSLAYAELDQLSNQLARTLLAQGVAPGDRVGILAPKSAAAVVALFGVLKAGACYVPLDPKSPAARLAAIMTDCGIAVVLADQATAPQAAALAGRLPALRAVIVAGPHWDRETAGIAPRRPAPGSPVSVVPATAPATTVPWEAVLAESAGPLGADFAIDTDLAYILYTSGSTGTPKGVMISHRASLTFVGWAAACVGLEARDRVCSPAPLHFDLSVFDVFAACAAGASMAVVPENMPVFPARLAQWLEREQVTVWYSVPSVLAMLAAYGNLRRYELSRLRTVIFAGEVFPAKHLSRLMTELPGARYLNWYGPTETNVCTWYEVPAGSAGLTAPVPIGRPCANTGAFAVTSAGGLVRVPGEEGELYVRGSGLMRGYWGDQEKTRQALVRNPFQSAYDEPAYRTGDLVTLDADGNYVFLGRRDGMVKTRGYRVELGEVEAVLYAHPAIAEAAVLPVPDELLGSRLRAVIGTGSPGGLTREEVLDHCRRRLPGYMVPDAVEFRATLPRTSTGKIDRALLAAPEEERTAGGRH